jgi:hypothetical protein
MRKFLPGVLCSALFVLGPIAAAQSDLDAFMREVLARRDDNWKKLQQYVLDEREQIVINGPNKLPLWGDRREYTWYIRDGFFVRSPVKFNGVTVSEEERRKFEADYLKRAQRMDERRGNRGQRPADPAIAEQPAAGGGRGDEPAPESVESFLKQTRQPGFVSSSYFLRFKFEEGKYALVGRETLDGRQVLRIEYYPARLFTQSQKRPPNEDSKGRAYDAELTRMLNKAAVVTLWIEPKAHQIVKYQFMNLPLDFLPGSWLVHIDELNAQMTMGQPFPDVWLPSHMDIGFAMSLAIGPIDAHYDVDYYDYKQADVTTKVKIR